MKERGSILEFFLFSLTSSFLLYVSLASCINASTLKTYSLSLALPSGLFANCVFVLKLLFWASSEEFIYRVYFPNKLEFFFLTQHHNFLSSFRHLSVWALPHLLFATAHSYLGLLNVLFAFFASICLRKIYISLQYAVGKIASFAIISMIHSFYNICILYLILS